MRKSLVALVLAIEALTSLAATPQTAVLDVQNVTCSLCAVTVKKAREKVPGVSQAQSDVRKQTATVSFDSDKTAVTLVKAPAEAGFPSAVRK